MTDGVTLERLFLTVPVTSGRRCGAVIVLGHQVPGDRANLLAVSQVMAGLRFPQEELLALLGGDQVMNESPVITKLPVKNTQGNIVAVLEGRFGKVPHEIVKRLSAVVKDKDLKALLRFAGQCENLAAFRERMLG